MTTIAVAKKNGYVAIAADTLTSFGNRKESATYLSNHEKIIKYKENYLAISGWGAFQQAVTDYLETTRKNILLDNVQNIFRAGLLIHDALKESYYLRPFDEESDSFETSRGNILIANPNGIFSLTDYRYTQEFSKFFAFGSGSDYALGAMFVASDNSELSAEEIVRVGINAGAEFDDGTGLPMNCFTVKLK